MKQLKQKHSLLYLLLLCIIACAVVAIVVISSNTTHTAFAATGEYDNSVQSSEVTQSTTTIIFQKNGGSGGSSLVTATYGEDMPEATAPTLKDYKFLGYFSESGVQYYDENMNSIHIWDKTDELCELLAHWKRVKFTVKLNFDGGEGGTEFVEVEYGADMPSGLTAPTKVGYNFLGYFSEDGKQYYDKNMNSSNIWDKEDAECNLYAHWEGKKYTVYLNFDGGEGGTESVVVEYGAVLPVGAIAPHKEGYDFKGYFSEHEGNGVQYYDENMNGINVWNYTIDGVIYACWENSRFYVYLNAGNGTGGEMSIQKYDLDMEEGHTVPIYKDEGYKFAGYFEHENGQGTKYYNADMSSAHVWDIAQDTAIYAYYEVISVNITLDANGGYIELSETKVPSYTFSISYFESVNLDDYLPKLVGKYFDGWYLKLNQYSGTITHQLQDLKLTARWLQRVPGQVYYMSNNLNYLLLNEVTNITCVLPDWNFIEPCHIIIPAEVQKVHIYAKNYNKYDLYIDIDLRFTEIDLYLENFAYSAPIEKKTDGSYNPLIAINVNSSSALNLYAYGDMYIKGANGIMNSSGTGYNANYAIKCTKINVLHDDNLTIIGGDAGYYGGKPAVGIYAKYIYLPTKTIVMGGYLYKVNAATDPWNYDAKVTRY